MSGSVTLTSSRSRSDEVSFNRLLLILLADSQDVLFYIFHSFSILFFLVLRLAAPIGRLRRPLAPEFVKPSPPEMLPLPPAPKSPETPAPRVPKPLPRPLQAPPTRPPVHRPEPEMEPAAAKEDSPQGPPAKEQDIKVIGETETKDVEMPLFPTARPAVQLAEQPMPESEVEEIKVSEKERQETREEEEKVHEIVDEEVDYEDDEEKEESEKEEAEVEDVIAENGDAEPQAMHTQSA